MPYSDYFALSENYYPVFSEAAVTDNNWQETYPHQTFIKLLGKAEKMLSRVDSAACKPIWIHGAYGTGKTRIAWTLKKLLTCPSEQLQDYFASYEELRRETALRDKLLGLKARDRIIAAMRFSSSSIQNFDDLVIAIYQSVTDALRERGMNTVEAESMQGAILAWLDDKLNRDILTTILKSEQYCHDGDLPDTADQVRERLAAGGNAALLGKLLKIARERRLLPIMFDVDTLIAWLAKIIEANELTALVLIWDEFSDFLQTNRKLYSDFQKLAHAAAKIPFYFLIVTHMTSKIFTEDDPGAMVVADRFEHFKIELPEYTAFKLIGHALKVKEDKAPEWEEISDDLNKRLEEARRAVKNMVKGGKEDKNLEVDDFRRILPIHPFAALVLKNIAENFSANQRSMFNFIDVKDEAARGFQYFISNHDPGDILSVDQLWDYFYSSGKGSLNLGRSNLEANIRLVMDTYPVHAARYAPVQEPGKLAEDSPEQRVLKAVIMLQALRYLSPDTVHFKATCEILDTAFQGIDGLDLGQAITIADQLVKDKVLFKDQGIYQVPLGSSVDQAKIHALIEDKRKSTSTRSLLKYFNEWDILPTDKALKSRLTIRRLTAGDFNRELNALINEQAKSWSPKVAMVFARTPAESEQVQKLLAEAMANDRANNIIFIDATATTMSPDRWEAYLEAAARASYFAGKDEDSQSKLESEQAEAIIRDWAALIRNGKFTIYTGRPARGRQLTGGPEVQAELKSLVRSLYPACWDYNLGVKETHLEEKIGPAVIKAGIAAVPQSPITKESVAAWLKDIGADNYWNLLAEHPLAKLRKALDRKATRAFAAGGPGRLEISEIIEDFARQGFMPSPLYSWLSGYLLKEFASSQYRASDGNISAVMDASRLADMIEKAFRHLQRPDAPYRPQYIEVLTMEQRAFAALAARLFNLDGDESLDLVAIKLGRIAKEWGYPFWAFAHAPEAPALQDFVSLFVEYLNPEAHNRAGYGEVASAIGKLVLARPEMEAPLQKLFTQENLQQGMVNWLNAFENGELPALARQIGAPDYLADVRSDLVGDAAWLWDDKVCGDVVRNILEDYRLAAESVARGFLASARSKDECMDGWRQKLYGLHLPCAVLQERYPDQRQVLKDLGELAKGKILGPHQRSRLLETVRGNEVVLHGIFNNAPAVFRSVYADILKGIPEREITNLYNSLPASSCRDERETFENELVARARAIRDRLKRSRLLTKWRDLTGTDDPATLANQTGTPVAAILREAFGSENCKAAIQVCRIVGNESATDAEMDSAEAFLGANAAQWQTVASQSQADLAFEHYIIGKNAAILKDASKVRAQLAEKLGNDVERWLDYPGWQDMVQGLATAEYKSSGVQAVRQKLATMAPEQAKALLASLGEDNFEVGMRILGG